MTPLDDGLTGEGFRRFWRAAAVAGLGTDVTLFALQALVVLTLHGSAADVGWVNAARWLPYLLVGLVVGAVVDGRRRLPLLIGTDLVQAVVLLLIPLLWWLDVLTLPVLMAVVLGYGTAAVISSAAEMSLFPRLVPRGLLQSAHARIDGTDAAASTVGPALGGVLVSAIGAPVVVLVDALSYLYSAWTLRGIRLEEPASRTGVTARGLLADVREGVRWVYAGSGLSTLAVATHVWFAAHAIVGVVLAPYVLRTLDLSAAQFGLIGAVGGVGAVLGAAITTAVGRRLGTGLTIITCHLVHVVAAVVFLLAGPGTALAVVAVGQGIYGLAMGMSNSHEMSYRQLVTPDELQARANTTMRSLNRAVVVFVAPVAGIVADAWGIRPMFAVAAVVFALSATILAVTPFRSVRAPV